MTTDPKPSGARAATAAEPQSAAAAPPVLRKRTGLDPRRLLAFGTGVGVEMRESELRVSIVRVRASETGVLGAATVPEFRTRPAGEWGTELGSFLRKVGVAHIAATVLLPRNEVIVRQVHLPGVSDKDLASAVQLQIDSLHPFADEDVYFSWARLGKSPYVLVGISRKDTIDAYSSLFAEAGIKVAAFTFSAAVLYSAARLITIPPPEFIAIHESGGVVEMYGESAARPVYSATLPVSMERAIPLARAEFRLDRDIPALRLTDILPKPVLWPANHDPNRPGFEENALPYATALAGACPWLGIDGNLLPAQLRRASSRVRLIPTVTLASLLAILVVVLALQSTYADSRYLGVLQHEIAKYEPQARRVDAIDKATAATRARSQSLDQFRRRAKLDMDALAEVTRLIPPPGWAGNLEMDRATIQIAGEVDQAATLLSTLDKSPLFEKSEFTMPISRSASGEMFRIRAQRQEPPPGTATPARNSAPAATPKAAPPPAEQPAARPTAPGGGK